MRKLDNSIGIKARLRLFGLAQKRGSENLACERDTPAAKVATMGDIPSLGRFRAPPNWEMLITASRLSHLVAATGRAGPLGDRGVEFASSVETKV